MIEYIEKQVTFLKFISLFVAVLGMLIGAFGFSEWYHKLQVPNDLILKAQVPEAIKPQSGNSPQPAAPEKPDSTPSKTKL